ncbi:MAG TPA: ATP-binding protein [Candidatus Nitrosotenuis sp.]|jgi:AAA+ ATPase superfamily predicted ATPase
MEQPFVVGKPVTGKYFIDRKSELKQLLALLSGTPKGDINNVILLGLRRTGKSSILLNAKKTLDKNKKIVPVIFDAYGISTKERFGRTFISKVLQTYVEKSGERSYKERIKKLLEEKYEKLAERVSEFDVEFAEYIKFQIKLREPKVNEDELLEAALQYPEKLGKDKGVYFVIMIDEFQELLQWDKDFLKMFRRLVQAQKHVAYVLAGSAPTIMKQMVYDVSSPFYKQLTEIRVGKLSQESVSSFVQKRLKSVKISIDKKALEVVFYLSHGFPDYVQRLGLQIFLRALESGKKQVEESDVQVAYSEMILQLDPDFNNNFSTFSPLEKEILIALATGSKSPAEISSEIRKPMSTLPKTLTRLMNQDVVEKYQEAKYRITDPILSDWLNRRYGQLTM